MYNQTKTFNHAQVAEVEPPKPIGCYPDCFVKFRNMYAHQESHPEVFGPRKIPDLYERTVQQTAHFIRCLKDAFKFRCGNTIGQDQSKFLVNSVSEPLYYFLLWRDLSPEKFYKWFYGNGIPWLCGSGDPTPLEGTAFKLTDVIKIFPRSLKRFLNNLQVSTARKFHHYKCGRRSGITKALSRAFTFSQFKKGSPAMPESYIQETAERHRSLLTKDRTGFEEFSTQEPKGLRDVNQLKMIANRLINSCFFEGEAKKIFSEDFPMPIPSFNSSFERNGLNRGPVGAAAEIAEQLEAIPEKRELSGVSFHPDFGVEEVEPTIYNPENFNRPADEDYNCRPVFLQEPLKIRAITMGPSIQYWLLKPLQKLLWKGLQRNPMFTLVGKPVSEEDVQDLYRSPYISDDAEVISLDYKDATDCLKSWLSRYIANRIAKRIGIPNWYRRDFVRSLIGHLVYMPLQFGIPAHDDFGARQLNGQLMGGICSFIVLCLANGVVCIYAVLHTGDWYLAALFEPLLHRFLDPKEQKAFRQTNRPAKIDFRAFPIKVNGDDGIILGDKQSFEHWSTISSFIGMEPSIGKCFFSKKFCTINSQPFCVIDGKVTIVPFLNLSLASPSESRGGKPRPYTSYGPCCREFISGFSYEKQERLKTLYVKRMMNSLKELPSGLIWGLPTWLGGLGLPWEKGRINKAMNVEDRLFASYLFLQGNEYSRIVNLLPPSSCPVNPVVERALRIGSKYFDIEPVPLTPSPELPEYIQTYYQDESTPFPYLIWRELVRYGGDKKVGNRKKKSKVQNKLKSKNKILFTSYKKARKDFQRYLKDTDEPTIVKLGTLLKYKGLQLTPQWETLDHLVVTNCAPRGLLAEISAAKDPYSDLYLERLLQFFRIENLSDETSSLGPYDP
jgi:hypothetical protein